MTTKTGAVKFVKSITFVNTVKGVTLPFFYAAAAVTIAYQQFSNSATFEKAQLWQNSLVKQVKTGVDLAKDQATLAFNPPPTVGGGSTNVVEPQVPNWKATAKRSLNDGKDWMRKNPTLAAAICIVIVALYAGSCWAQFIVVNLLLVNAGYTALTAVLYIKILLALCAVSLAFGMCRGVAKAVGQATA